MAADGKHRRRRCALAALSGGAVGKDVVSRVWRKMQRDWETWNKRSLADEPIVRLILEGAVVRVQLDRRPASLSLLVVLLTVKNMGGETVEALRTVLDVLVRRSLRRPDLRIVDGGAGLESALPAICGDEQPTQRCTVHKDRNLLANAIERLHDEIAADHNDMNDADTPQEVQNRSKDFLHEWRLRHPAVAGSLEEAGDGLFTFTILPPSRWKSARPTNAIEQLREELKRRIKTHTVLSCADTAAMRFWVLLASGQIIMRKIDGCPQNSSARLADFAA
jgi:putative transposase